MNRTALIFFVVLFIATGLTAGVAGLLVGSQDTWSPRDYVPDGDGMLVPPRGDALYDEHYAKNVNVPNAQAYNDQAQGQYTDATTQRVEWETRQSQIAVFSMLVVMALIFFILLVAVIGGSHGTVA